MGQVGLVAINDGIVLESCIYRVLQRHFRDQPYYAQLLELFHEVNPPPPPPAPVCLPLCGMHAGAQPSRCPLACCGADAVTVPLWSTDCRRNVFSKTYTRQHIR